MYLSLASFVWNLNQSRTICTGRFITTEEQKDILKVTSVSADAFMPGADKRTHRRGGGQCMRAGEAWVAVEGSVGM